MKLSGYDFNLYHQVLCEAYTHSSLQLMVRVALEENLEVVAGGNNFSEVVFNLITWAEQYGRIEQLVQASLQHNSDNPKLQSFVSHMEKPFKHSRNSEVDTDATSYQYLRHASHLAKNKEQGFTIETEQKSVALRPFQRPPRNEHFYGRTHEVELLIQDLQPDKVITICGPGGIGKTALIAEAIWRIAPDDELPAHFPDGIFFHSFEDQHLSILALEEIARSFGEEPHPTPADAAKRALAGKKALLILDSAEKADDLQHILEIRNRCCVLIASRQRTDAMADRRDLNPLSLDEAGTILKSWAANQIDDQDAVKRICELVGGLPLALRMIGRYLSEHQMYAKEYLDWLMSTPLVALDQGQRQKESITLLLERSIAEINQNAQQALGILGLLAQTPFERDVVTTSLGLPIDIERQIFGELVNYGLVRRQEREYIINQWC